MIHDRDGVHLQPGVPESITRLVVGQDPIQVALDILRNADEEYYSPRQKAAVCALAERYKKDVTPDKLKILDTRSHHYKDTRQGMPSHPALDFHMYAEHNRRHAATVLKELLGDGAKDLMSDWEGKVNFDDKQPYELKFTIFKEQRSQDAISAGNIRGFELSDDLQAIMICAHVLRKAKDLGLQDIYSDFERPLVERLRKQLPHAAKLLDASEITLLAQLHKGQGAKVMTRSGELFIANGQLRGRLHRDD